MNRIIVYILLAQFCFCGVVASVGGVWYEQNDDEHVYLDARHSVAANTIISFFSYFLLMNTLIPISLVVTLEVIKIVQAYFIIVDTEMYSEERERFAKVSTTSINEELGQIDYIFSDKTGTLTRNVMEFKLFSVGTQLYGDIEALNGVKDNNIDEPITPNDDIPLNELL